MNPPLARPLAFCRPVRIPTPDRIRRPNLPLTIWLNRSAK